MLSCAFYGLLGSRYDPEITAAIKQTKLVIHSSKRKFRMLYMAPDISGLLELQFTATAGCTWTSLARQNQKNLKMHWIEKSEKTAIIYC